MKSFNLLPFVLLSYSVVAQISGIDAINSAFDEQGPVFSPDGQSLYFTIANHPQNKGGQRDPGDIWVSSFENGTWTAPVHAGSDVNDNAYNGVAGFSSDGRIMYLLSHYDKNNSRAKTMGISASEKNGNGWSKPKNISIPYFNNKSLTMGTVSSDSNVFVYSAEGYGSYGVEDIFVCVKQKDGTYSAPKNLGSKINTRYQELSPSISNDGKTLYFSSNGHGGNGSFDIFFSKRLDDSWTNWSEPTLVSSNVNSSGRELFFRLVPQLGVFIYTSTTNSDGYGDIRIYKPDTAITSPEPVMQQTMEEPVATISEQPILRSINTRELSGKVLNEKTSDIVNARLTFFTDEDPIVAQAHEKGYYVNLPKREKYKIKVEAPGYLSKMEEVTVYDLGDSEQWDFTLIPAEDKSVVNLKGVLFEKSTTNLLPESFEELNMVVTFLNENPTIDIELAGHTDNRGSAKDNVRLSQERVDRVKEYLVSQGVDPARVSGKGYGGARPIASNSTEESRKLNRRVEFVVKKR